MSTDDWCTPRDIARELGRFDIDPCSNARSHIVSTARCALDHRDPTQRDGLTFTWAAGASVFVNWPYSNPLPWARRCAAHDGPWVALAKLDPSTKWWAALMDASPTVAPFRKRLRFEGAPGAPTMTANFPSVLVYSAWRPSVELAARLWLPTYSRATCRS